MMLPREYCFYTVRVLRRPPVQEGAMSPWLGHGLVCSGNFGTDDVNEGCLGDSSQLQAGADIEKLHARTSTPAVQRSDNSDDMLRIGNMDTHQ